MRTFEIIVDDAVGCRIEQIARGLGQSAEKLLTDHVIDTFSEKKKPIEDPYGEGDGT